MIFGNFDFNMDTVIDLPTEEVNQDNRSLVTGGLYVLTVFMAAVMRLSGLESVPLSPTEAIQALNVWQNMQPGNTAVSIQSPAYFSLTSLFMAFFGDSDMTARLVPALFGIGLVLLPWFLRERLGSMGALVTAVLLAISPLNAVVSRTVGGDALAIFAVGLTAVALIRTYDTQSKPWRYILAIAIGLGITSAPLFYTGLITLMLAGLLSQFVGPKLNNEEVFSIERDLWGTMAVFFFVTALLLSTRFLTYLPGIGAAAGIFGDWITQFTSSGGLQQLLEPFLALVRYELVLVILGIFAILWAVWRNQPLGTLLVYWLTGALIILLLQRGTLNNTLIITLASYLLLGLFTNHILRKAITWHSWLMAAILALLGGAIVVNIARFLRTSVYGTELANIWMSLIIFVVATFALYFMWIWSETAVIQGSLLAVLILLSIYQWGTAWNLTHTNGNNPQERWVTTATADSLPLMASTLRDVSRQVVGSDYDINIHSAVDTPALRWYLRDFQQAQFGNTLPPGTQTAALITPKSMAEPFLGSDYLGSDFDLTTSGTATLVSSETPVQDTLRFWFFHESNMQPERDGVILWVRADLIQ